MAGNLSSNRKLKSPELQHFFYFVFSVREQSLYPRHHNSFKYSSKNPIPEFKFYFVDYSGLALVHLYKMMGMIPSQEPVMLNFIDKLVQFYKLGNFGMPSFFYKHAGCCRDFGI